MSGPEWTYLTLNVFPFGNRADLGCGQVDIASSKTPHVVVVGFDLF